MRKLVVVLAVVSVALAGCGRSDQALRISSKKLALDLAFKAEKAKKKNGRKVIAAQPAVGAGAVVPRRISSYRPLPPVPPAQASCPHAPHGASVEEPATVAIHSTPRAGSFVYTNKGTFSLEQGSTKLGPLPYPIYTERVIRNVKTTSDGYTFEIFQRGLDGQSQITTSYRITPTALQIAKLVQKTSDGTSTTNPTPPVTLMTLGRGVGATWDSVGVDTDSRTVMQTHGVITKREVVDVCGKLYDTFRVESSEHFFNSFSGYDYKTDDDHPTIYNVATQYGGLVLHEDVEATVQLPTDAGTATVRLDYAGTVQSIQPR